jgi:hypothetical protein
LNVERALEEPITKSINETERTNFYRWRKKVEKRKIDGFQVVKVSGNTSFIGLKSADPNAIARALSSTQETPANHILHLFFCHQNQS